MKKYKITLNFSSSSVPYHLEIRKKQRLNQFTGKNSSYVTQEKMSFKKENVAGQRHPLCKWELSCSPLSSSDVFPCHIKAMKQPI